MVADWVKHRTFTQETGVQVLCALVYCLVDLTSYFEVAMMQEGSPADSQGNIADVNTFILELFLSHNRVS